MSTAPTKAKSQEPAYSRALIENKIDRQRIRSRVSGRQTVRGLWWMVFGVETGAKAGPEADISECPFQSFTPKFLFIQSNLSMTLFSSLLVIYIYITTYILH